MYASSVGTGSVLNGWEVGAQLDGSIEGVSKREGRGENSGARRLGSKRVRTWRGGAGGMRVRVRSLVVQIRGGKWSGA